ncbi:MAG: alpha/beta fold hydrolase [Cyanobacteria bacterium P01_G01_bin.67]
MKIRQLFLVITELALGIGIVSLATVTSLKPLPVNAAERISFYLPVWGEFHLSMDSLETFAQEGRITPEFAYYAKHLDQETLQNFRRILQTNFAVDPITIYRLTNMPMGEDFLLRIGKIIYTHPERNGLYAIRSALILAAAEPDGLTAINFLRHFPTGEMQLNTNLIFSLVKEVKSFLRYRDTTIEAIAQQATTETKTQSATNLKQIPALEQPGAYQVTKKNLTLAIDDLRQTPQGFLGNYELNADIYLPQGLASAAPLAIITHGLGSKPADYDYLAEHLASHGFVVALPEHLGSSSRYKDAYLEGEVGVDFSPIEFYSRPRDITHLLDRLEQHPDFKQRINWSQIGVIGHSLGGTTALIAAGAPINLARINHICSQDRLTHNVSLILQCRANNLPPGKYNLQDTRIKAVMALNPVTSSILGVESLQQISIPTFILGGSADYIAPFIQEQAHPFLWLTTAHKYLATVVNGSHFSTLSKENMAEIDPHAPDAKKTQVNLGRGYLKTLSLAFLEAHTRDRHQYQSYLTAGYAAQISHPELPLHLIQSLTSEQLALAYGKIPPVAPISQPLIREEPPENSPVIAEIKRTGVLKVALRTDAAPFGYINQEQDWVGYCDDLAHALGDRLELELATVNPIKVVKRASSLNNRFKLIEQAKAHLECGPNSIVDNRQEVVFSDPFFSSGTRFLVRGLNTPLIDFNSSLKGIKLGVLEATTSQQFLAQEYPDAEIVTYESKNRRNIGAKEINNGEIDAFVSDTVLLTGQLNHQNLNPKNYQTIPEQPLTCDYYGLILPADDPHWRKTINTFIRDRTSKKVFHQWLNSYYTQAITDLDYCQNRR